MHLLWQNIRYSLRALRKNSGFTTVAVLSLALGIGANTAIFTLINPLLLRDVPVRQPERLVEVSPVLLERKITFSYPMYRELERQQRVFSAVIGWSSGDIVSVEVNGTLSQNEVYAVSGNFYSELGATPLFGRLLTPEDAAPHSGCNRNFHLFSTGFGSSFSTHLATSCASSALLLKQCKAQGALCRSFRNHLSIRGGIPLVSRRR